MYYNKCIMVGLSTYKKFISLKEKILENIESLIVECEDSLLQIDRLKATEIFDKCFKIDQSFKTLETLAISALEKIGQGWESGNISLAQVYMSGIICEELIDSYLPKLEVDRADVPKMAIAVLQDQHALGKRIVLSILKSGGFKVIDFGKGLSVDELVEKTIENKIEILLISTLMLPSALKVKEVRDKFISKGYNVKIVVGGAPFRLDSTLWKSVCADAEGTSASDIIKTLEDLLKGAC